MDPFRLHANGGRSLMTPRAPGVHTHEEWKGMAPSFELFCQDVLAWQPDDLRKPEELAVPVAVHLDDYDEVLRPDWIVPEPSQGDGALPKGADGRRSWEATPQQRLERLLKESEHPCRRSAAADQPVGRSAGPEEGNRRLVPAATPRRSLALVGAEIFSLMAYRFAGPRLRGRLRSPRHRHRPVREPLGPCHRRIGSTSSAAPPTQTLLWTVTPPQRSGVIGWWLPGDG